MAFMLFEKDWKRFPDADYDLTTKNRSFVEVVSLLKGMGVKNHLFPLTLMNIGLKGVDPYDPDLDEATKTMIILECTWNPWYFIREVMRVPPAAGDTPVSLNANRANISLWWCFLNHIDYFLTQPRQTGKSLNSDGISVWFQIFGTTNTRANLFTKNDDLIKENIKRLKKIRKLLPSWMVEIVKADTDNQREFTNMAQGNRYVATQAQANEDAARNVGRGLTAAMNVVDEVAFLKFVHISVPAMLAGSGAARTEARRNGMPFGNLFTTTAGKIDTPEGEFAYRMMNNGMPWTEMLYDCHDEEDLYRTVRANCKTDTMLINGTFSHRQLGFDDDWLRQRIAEAQQSGDEARRDFLNQWTAGTLSNPLSTDILEKINKNSTDPYYQQRYPREGYVVRWYVEVEEVLLKLRNRQLIMGVDTSNATGRDNITAVITDASTLEVVGVFSTNETNLQVFSGWLARFLMEYTNITVVPEARSTWIGILDYLLVNMPLQGGDPSRRIYNTIVDQKNDSERQRDLYAEYTHPSSIRYHYASFRRHFGFPTNGPLRELLYGSVLQEAGKKTGHLVRDKVLAKEISGLQTKNGRVDHGAGKNDDHVISWLLTHWFLAHAKNLDHYGIDVSQVKRKVWESDHQLSWKEENERDRQLMIREEIEMLMEELQASRSDIDAIRIEHRLKSMYRKLNKDAVSMDIGSLDALIKESGERRTQSANMNRREATGMQGRDFKNIGRNGYKSRNTDIVEC